MILIVISHQQVIHGTAHNQCEKLVKLLLLEQIIHVPAPDHGELMPEERLTPTTTSSEVEMTSRLSSLFTDSVSF